MAFTTEWTDRFSNDEFQNYQQIIIDGELAASRLSVGAGLWGGKTYIGNNTVKNISWGGQIDEVRLLDYAIAEPATLSLIGVVSLLFCRRK